MKKSPFFITFLMKHNKQNTPSQPPEVIPAISEKTDAYIQSGSVDFRTDGKPISDEEVPHLIQAGYENTLQRMQESNNPKYHRTPHEEELSLNFFMKYHDKAFEMADKSCVLYTEASKTHDLSRRIKLLNEAVIAFEKARNFCYSKGKGGAIYFQDMWEYMSNSENPCYSYLNVIQDALNEAISERDVLIPDILNVISENDGILQKDIYNLLPHIDKSKIQRIIRTLETENKLVRAKKAGTYELHIHQ